MSDKEATTTEAKKPGRPPKQSDVGMKKGKPVWKPASVVDVVDKQPGKRYRLVNKDPDNMARKRAEGWEIESGVNTSSAKILPDGRIETGSQLTSVYERKDVILMTMPEELAQSRDAYINEKTRKRTVGLTAHLKREIRDKGGNAPVHGDITISSLRGEQVID